MASTLREQNTERLNRLHQQVTTFGDLAKDINRHARDTGALNAASTTASDLTAGLTSSSKRMVRMAQAGDKVAIFKLAAIIVVSVLTLWWIWGLFRG